MIHPAFPIEFVFVAFFKRELSVGQLSAAERLHILEWLDGCARGPVPTKAIAAIAPANDVFAQMVTEAIRAAAGTEDGRPCFEIIERVFYDLAKINPSIARAVELCRR